MHTSRSALAVAAFVALATALPAKASTEVAMTVRDFVFTLRDLNAADGITPSLAWMGSAELLTSSRDDKQIGWTVNNYGGSISHLTYEWSNEGHRHLFGSTALATQSMLGWGDQAVSSSPSGAPGVLSLAHQIDAGSTASGQANWQRSFLLSAGSEVSISVIVDGAFSSTGQPGVLTDLSGTRNQAAMTASLDVGPYNRTLSTFGYTNWMNAQNSFDQVIEGETVRLTLRNDSAVPMSYVLNLSAYISASDTVSPVPEPSTYALMALGLAGIGLAARRRRRG